MSDEGENINENINQPSEETPSSVSEYKNESEIVSPVTEVEKEGVVETAREEPLEEQNEQLESSTIEQPSPSQLEVKAKPKKQKPKAISVNKIQKFLVDTSNQIIKHTTQINKINQNLESLQKQMKGFERQAGMVNQIHSQLNQIQKHISQVHKIVQKRPASKLQSSKKTSRKNKRSKK